MSPVPVGAGAPGSRPQSGGEIPPAERGVESLFGGSKRAGRNIEVNPAASSESQSESRAAHVTAKAMPAALVPERPVGLRGVRGAARTHGSVWNRRDPSVPPTSGKDRSYKPMVKSSGGQRESEGAIVVMSGVDENAPGAKGPHFGRVCGGGKRQGMAGPARSNFPDRCQPVDSAREPRGGLWAVVKRDPGRRCHARFDRAHEGDVRWAAWERVQRRPVGFGGRVGTPTVRSSLDIPLFRARVAASGRPSVSRVRENRTHGLKGEGGNGPA